MALTEAQKEIIDLVAQEEKDAQRAALIANAATQTAVMPDSIAVVEGEAPVADNQALAVSTAGAGVALNSAGLNMNPKAFLEANGLTGFVDNFTSFPKVTLKDGSFHTVEHPDFGKKLEFQYISHENTYVFKGIDPVEQAAKGRDYEPEMVYSDDGENTNGEDSRTIASVREEWLGKGWRVEKDMYQMILVQCFDGPHADELVKLQIPPASQGKLGGYVNSLARKGMLVTNVVTEASIGSRVGTGSKAFTPWAFKLVQVILPQA